MIILRLPTADTEIISVTPYFLSVNKRFILYFMRWYCMFYTMPRQISLLNFIIRNAVSGRNIYVYI